MTLLFNSHFGINAFTFYLPSHLLLVQKLEYKILFLKPRLLEHFTSKYGVEKSIFHLDSEVNL